MLSCPIGTGSGETDFGPQLKGLDKKRFTVVAFDPRGYGRSRPPDRDFPSDFFHRDAQDGLQLMQVRLDRELMQLLLSAPPPTPIRSEPSSTLST